MSVPVRYPTYATVSDQHLKLSITNYITWKYNPTNTNRSNQQQPVPPSQFFVEP